MYLGTLGVRVMVTTLLAFMDSMNIILSSPENMAELKKSMPKREFTEWVKTMVEASRLSDAEKATALVRMYEVADMVYGASQKGALPKWFITSGIIIGMATGLTILYGRLPKILKGLKRASKKRKRS